MEMWLASWKCGYDTPPPYPSRIAFDFLFVKSRVLLVLSCAPLSCFSEFVKWCALVKCVKTILSLCQLTPPSNSRDVPHMTQVTNQCCVIYIMWCISYCVTHITWSDSHSSCCVSLLTYSCVTHIMWSESPSWPTQYDLHHLRNLRLMIYVTKVI